MTNSESKSARAHVCDWSDPTLLKSIKNPTDKPYWIRVVSEEVTFLGVPDQPDFARVKIAMIPDQKVIELKSLKMYFGAFRGRVLSYERFINVLYDDLMAKYAPVRLRITVVCNPRGGIKSELVVDSKDRADV